MDKQSVLERIKIAESELAEAKRELATEDGVSTSTSAAMGYVSFEFSPVRDWWRPSPRSAAVEVCDPEDAHYYGVYGRVKDDCGNLLARHLFDCVGQADAEEAVALLTHLSGSPPSLRSEDD